MPTKTRSSSSKLGSGQSARAGIHRASSNLQSPNNQTVLTTFTCFGKLPIELRFKIWKEASNATRNICVFPMDVKWIHNLGYCTVKGHELDYDDELEPFSYESSDSPPPVLHTCQESRAEGLKYYSLEFGMEWKFRKSSLTVSIVPKTYINWQVDRLCFPDFAAFRDPEEDRFRHIFQLCKTKGLKYMAVNASDYPEQDESFTAVCHLGMQLKELAIFSDFAGTIEKEVWRTITQVSNCLIPKNYFQRQLCAKGVGVPSRRK
jgi:2EXR family